jgi:hypothetical protein
VHTLGQERASAVPKERTAAGLVQAALEHALSSGMAKTSLRGFFIGTRATPGAMDLSEHCVRVMDLTHEAAPPNLYLTPSVVNSEEDMASLEIALMDAGTVCGCRSDSWRQAVAPLRAAMAATAGRWVVFYDTDAELRERAPSRLALSVADRAVVLMSADWRAYIRLKADGRNSFFRFLEQLHKAGQPHAKIHMILMNGIPIVKSAVCQAELVPAPLPPTPGTTLKLPFTTNKILMREMPQIASNVYEHINNKKADATLRKLWYSEEEATGMQQKFFDRYIQVIQEFPVNLDQVTTGTGIPIVSLEAGKDYRPTGVRQRAPTDARAVTRRLLRARPAARATRCSTPLLNAVAAQVARWPRSTQADTDCYCHAFSVCRCCRATTR